MKITFNSIIETLVQTTNDLKNQKIDINTAKQICTNTQTLINAAKLQFEVLKHFKDIDSDFFKHGVDTSKNLTSEIPIPYKDQINKSIEQNRLIPRNDVTDVRKYNSEFKNKDLEKQFNSDYYSDDYKSKVKYL